MRTLTLLSGPVWPLSPRVRRWLADEPRLVRLEVVAPGSPEAAERFPTLPPSVGTSEFAAVADDGRVWTGPSAWVIALWALSAHRGAAIRLARTGRGREARRIAEALARGAWFVSARLRVERPTSESGPRSPPAGSDAVPVGSSSGPSGAASRPARPACAAAGLLRLVAAVGFATAAGTLAGGRSAIDAAAAVRWSLGLGLVAYLLVVLARRLDPPTDA